MGQALVSQNGVACVKQSVLLVAHAEVGLAAPGREDKKPYTHAYVFITLIV